MASDIYTNRLFWADSPQGGICLLDQAGNLRLEIAHPDHPPQVHVEVAYPRRPRDHDDLEKQWPSVMNEPDMVTVKLEFKVPANLITLRS
jgi:hypothetical protein